MGNYAAHTIEWSSFGCTTPTQGDEGLSSNNDTTLPDGDQICIKEEDGARFEMSYQVGLERTQSGDEGGGNVLLGLHTRGPTRHTYDVAAGGRGKNVVQSCDGSD